MKHRRPTRTNNQTSTGAAILLRLAHGDMSEIARRLQVDRSLVSRVARGQKSSERVRRAIVRFLLRRGGAL